MNYQVGADERGRPLVGVQRRTGDDARGGIGAQIDPDHLGAEFAETLHEGAADDARAGSTPPGRTA